MIAVIIVLVVLFIVYVIWDRSQDELREQRLIDQLSKEEPKQVEVVYQQPWWGWGGRPWYNRRWDYRRDYYDRPRYRGGGAHSPPPYRPHRGPAPYYAGPGPRPHRRP